MRSSLKLGLALLGLAVGTTSQVQAQSTGSINATVNVLSALTVTGQQDLNFGNIAPTQTKTVAVTDANAGRFQINGAVGSSVTFSITSLPANAGAASLALGSWTGYASNTNTPAASTFTPATGYSDSYTLDAATGNYYVYLGATLTATAATPGTYSAPIQVSVIYN